jgi:hypothetical protein
MCACDIFPNRVNGEPRMYSGTQTADDGCTVCTCGTDTGGAELDWGFNCDSSACK